MTAHAGVRVLVVEDDYLVGEMTQGLLLDIGLVVAGTATHGQEGVEMARLLKPDVILMDIAMSGMEDGIEATRRIQQLCPTPVVALTAYESSDLVDKASAAGIGAYLVKPANAQELERAITIAMARFHDMMEVRRLQAQLQESLAATAAATAHLRLLQSLLPLCPNCRQTRTDAAYWGRVREYMQAHSAALAESPRCPNCGQASAEP